MTTDMVNSPPHYTTGKIEVLDFIEDQRFGYLSGQVVKYVARYRHKGKPVEDLQKAQFYLARLIKTAEAAGISADTFKQHVETAQMEATPAPAPIRLTTPFDCLLGQFITCVEIGSHDIFLRITTEGGRYVWEAQGDCCSASYINEITGLGTLTYEVLQDVREVPMPNNADDGPDVYTQLYGYHFMTRLGTSALVFRNESNGYYGGWLERLTAEPKDVTWQVLYGNEWRT